MIMEKKGFFTQEFYENPTLTLDVFNKLASSDHVATIDMYRSGTFLYMEVFENDETKEILSQVISNLSLYKEYNNEGWTPSEPARIGLCALHYEHQVFFGYDKEIARDLDSEIFVFNEDKDS